MLDNVANVAHYHWIKTLIVMDCASFINTGIQNNTNIINGNTLSERG